MSKVDVFNSGWIDLVFEGRNQSYGAYQLRRDDSKTTMLALFTGVTIMAIAVSIPFAINYLNPGVSGTVIPPLVMPESVIVELEDTHSMPELPKPEPQQAAAPVESAPPAAQATAPTVEFRPITATSDPVDVTLTTQTVTTTNPGTTTTEGTNAPGLGTGTDTSGIATGTGATGSAGDGVENFVDVMPLFPGGINKFYAEVSRKFRTPDTERAMSLKVYVSFVVEKDGSMTNIKVMRNPGYGMADEAIRVLKSIKTKWKPGEKNGKTVRTAYNLPITINVQ